MTEAEAIEAMARARWEHKRQTRGGLKKWEDISNDWAGICQGIRDEEAAAFAALLPSLDTQFAAGAEAMREMCEKACWEETRKWANFGGPEEEYGAECCAETIRDLPTPLRGYGGGA